MVVEVISGLDLAKLIGVDLKLAIPIIGRLRIWTNGMTISHVGHIPDGFGKMKTLQEWEQVP